MHTQSCQLGRRKQNKTAEAHKKTEVSAAVPTRTLYLAVLMSLAAKPSVGRPPSSGTVRLVSATAPFFSCANSRWAQGSGCDSVCLRVDHMRSAPSANNS